MTPLKKIIFAGTPQFAVPSLEALLAAGYDICAVYTQPDRPAGRGQHLTPSPVKLFAQQHHLAIYQPTSLNNPVAALELETLEADLMVVAAYGLLLPKLVLNLPRYGCINVHASLLPRWRGAAPIQRAILEGDTQTGITIMQMDVGLDTGAMLRSAACAILPEDNAQTLHDRLAKLGAETLLQSLQDLQIGKLKPVQQDDALACYAAKLAKTEAQLDWCKSAAELAKVVRAFNPWPVAYTYHTDNQLVKIWQVSVSEQIVSALPGTIVALQSDCIEVATGNGVLQLRQLQLPGGKMLSAEQLLHAHSTRFHVGSRFV